jgi:CheY-like chemotaxis protein
MYEFLINSPKADEVEGEVWPILIVDDEPAVHAITRFSLEDEVFEGKKFSFISAFSGAEAKDILNERNDIALVLLDVVMETDSAGLDVAHWIRKDLKNNLIRIILRTGQPGQAPEKTVIVDYDIFDYKNKTELTAQKLFSSVISGLRSYKDVLALANHSEGLKKVVESTANLFKQQYANQYASGVLMQLTSVLYHSADSLLVNLCVDENVSQKEQEKSQQIIAATGHYQKHVGESYLSVIPKSLQQRAFQSEQTIFQLREDNSIIFVYKSRDHYRTILYLKYQTLVSNDDMSMIELYVQSVAIAQERLRFWQETEDSLNEIITALSKTFEKHANKGDSYFTGVTKIATLLAKKHGLVLKRQITKTVDIK